MSHQIVVKKYYHEDVLSLPNELPLVGHLGINKTYQKILSHYYGLGLHRNMVKFCRGYHICLLKPIPPAEELFSQVLVLVDCNGPLPKTKSGNNYQFTIMCMATIFPEAIALRNIKAHTVIKIPHISGVSKAHII